MGAPGGGTDDQDRASHTETDAAATARPAAVPAGEGERRVTIVRRLLSLMPPGRLLDLGTGHGRFAMVARDLGWRVTAVDARTKRMPEADGIEWVEADVRVFPIEREQYDAVLLLGLLYHLEVDAQLALLGACAGLPTIVDTHLADRVDVHRGGYGGQLFDELAGRTPAQLRSSGTASWGNELSFWPTEDELLRMMRASGYQAVFPLKPWYRPDRTFYLCL